MKRLYIALGFAGALSLTACAPGNEPNLQAVAPKGISNTDNHQENGIDMMHKIQKTDAEWKAQLTPAQYHVLREKGTESPFSGKYYRETAPGMYVCAGCGAELFASSEKFDAGCGWPSFLQPIAESTLEVQEDRSYGMVRTEVLCAQCGGHLGHVFEDGPTPTGLRYCINSTAIQHQKTLE